MGGQDLCDVTADRNKILITSQATKHKQIDNLMFCGLTCDFFSISSNTTQALAAHFDFTLFLPRPFLVLGRSFFTARVFWLRYT